MGKSPESSNEQPKQTLLTTDELEVIAELQKIFNKNPEEHLLKKKTIFKDHPVLNVRKAVEDGLLKLGRKKSDDKDTEEKGQVLKVSHAAVLQDKSGMKHVCFG